MEKKIALTFEDFIKLINDHCEIELELEYKGTVYGITQFNGYEFYEPYKKESYQCYMTSEEFARKVNIKGELLKDIWDDVDNVRPITF